MVGDVAAAGVVVLLGLPLLAGVVGLVVVVAVDGVKVVVGVGMVGIVIVGMLGMVWITMMEPALGRFVAFLLPADVEVDVVVVLVVVVVLLPEVVVVLVMVLLPLEGVVVEVVDVVELPVGLTVLIAVGNWKLKPVVAATRLALAMRRLKPLPVSINGANVQSRRFRRCSGKQ